jgi:hypothetical protein
MHACRIEHVPRSFSAETYIALMAVAAGGVMAALASIAIYSCDSMYCFVAYFEMNIYPRCIINIER